MNRTLCVSALAVCAAALYPKAEAAQKPNVIIILADDIGFGDFSCNGAKTISLPNVDRVAASGVRFTNAHATSATSTPSRYGMLTGTYPWRVEGTGIATGDAGMIIPPGTFTVATMMQDAGYKTGAVGKWHLGLGKTAEQHWNGFITPGLKDIGFDYSFIMAATGDRVPCVYIENQRVYNYDADAPIAVSYKKNFEGEPTGKLNPEMLTLHPSQGHDMSIVNGISRIGFMKGGGKALWKDDLIAEVITSKAVSFIEDCGKEPFFLYFGTNDIHVPRVPADRFVGKSGMGARGDALLEFDWSVGEILKTLDKMGIADNTILIITSDNGPVVDDGYKDRAVELLGEHRPWGDMRGGKYSAFEAGTRIPFIVRWPEQIAPNQVSDALVSQIDMLASLAELNGTAIPEGSAKDSQARLSAFTGKDKKGRDWVVEQNLYNTMSILVDGWKYIEPNDGPAYGRFTRTEYGNSKHPQLYNLKEDIGEKNNVAQKYPQNAAKLQKHLTQIKTTSDTRK